MYSKIDEIIALTPTTRNTIRADKKTWSVVNVITIISFNRPPMWILWDKLTKDWHSMDTQNIWRLGRLLLLSNRLWQWLTNFQNMIFSYPMRNNTQQLVPTGKILRRLYIHAFSSKCFRVPTDSPWILLDLYRVKNRSDDEAVQDDPSLHCSHKVWYIFSCATVFYYILKRVWLLGQIKCLVIP